jgi:hypothetical protein
VADDLPKPDDLICSRCGYLPDETELVEQGEGLCPCCGSQLEEIGEVRPCTGKGGCRGR